MKKRNNSYYDHDAPDSYYGGSYEYFEEGSSEPYSTDSYNPYGSYEPRETHDDTYESQKASPEASYSDNYTYTPDSFDPGSAYGETPQEPESEYGPYSYGSYSLSSRRKKPIALAAAAVAAVIMAAVLLPTILHNRADAGGLPTVPYETPVVPTHAVQTQAPVPTSTPTPTPTNEPPQSTALPAVGLSADDTPYLYYRGLLSPENQTAYDIIAAGIAARQDSIEFGIKKESDIGTVCEYIARDRADFFWWNGGESWSYYEVNDGYMITLEPTYIKSAEEIQILSSEIERICADVISNTRYSSDYEKIRMAHDFIINRTIYDFSYPGADISVFFTVGRGVCEGYARSFKYMMDRMGIPSLYLGGGDHAWNLVCADGKWYQIDVTWDDPISDSGEQMLLYTYFCITDEEMYRTHVCDYAAALPICDSTDANYYVVSGRMLQSYDENTLRQWINEDYPVSGKVEFKCASEAVYRETYNRLSTNAEIWDLLTSTSAANHNGISWSFDDDYYIVSIQIN